MVSQILISCVTGVARLLVVCGTLACPSAQAAAQSGPRSHANTPEFGGLLDDGLTHPPPAAGAFGYNNFVPPVAGGASYTEPVFGTTVRRITADNSPDDIYARNMWWSADESKYLHRVTNFGDYWEVIDVATGKPTHTGIIGYGGLASDGGFDPVDPNVLYYFSGPTIHKITLKPDGNWSDSEYFTTPGSPCLFNLLSCSQGIESLGGSINWMDASGRYMLVRYGPEPSVHLFDRQNLAAGPYAGEVHGDTTVGTGSYVGITPDGNYLVGFENGKGVGLFGYQAVSWPIDHATRTVGAKNVFWMLCGDHASFNSASDGRNYMISNDCAYSNGVWRVDITNNATGVDGQQQQKLPHNKLLVQFPSWNYGSHYTSVTRGPLRDWAFVSTEDATDTFNSDPSEAKWVRYRQGILAINVVTGEVRHLAHHRSRSIGQDYFSQPRLSASWEGKYVGWASNFNQSGNNNIYAVQLGPSDLVPSTVSHRR